jgi:flagellar L-ring protein precursor FlgH
MKTTLADAREPGKYFLQKGEHQPIIGGRRGMSPAQEFRWFTLAVIGWMIFLLFAAMMIGQKPATASKPDPATTSLNEYLKRVRASNGETMPTQGSIWIDAGRLSRINTDVRAMRPHDLISVVVTESLSASTTGTVANSRATSASSQISALFGALHAGNALQNLINQNSASALAAKGDSETSSSLNTTLGGQVIEVLPNGMLVIEAARQVEFNQQTQTIVLRGLVRPEDISQQNQITSTAISSLELEVRGKGIINDYTHRQNALVRFLEKLLIF